MSKWFVLLIITMASLTACIGIESEISFRRDGSGSLTFTYTVSQMIKELDSSGSAKNLPLPVTEEDFSRTAESIEGLRLRRISQREDEENVYIEASMDFDSIESVNRIGNKNQVNLSLTVQNGTTTFRQVIFSRPEEQEISEDSLRMIETFFKDYELCFIVETPSSIKGYSFGELSPDKRRLTYRVTMPELLRSDGDKILEVKW